MNKPFAVSSCLTGLFVASVVACSAESAAPARGNGGSTSTGNGGSTTSPQGGNVTTGNGGTTSNGQGGATGFSGSTGTSGAVGAAGASTCPSTPAKLTAQLLDDLEDGDNVISAAMPLAGYWYSYSDGTATLTPDPAQPWAPKREANGTSMWAACASGTGFTSYGAGIGFNVMDLGNKVLCPVDGTGLTGIKFKAKGSGNVRVQVARKSTASPANGGTCSAATGCDYSAWAKITLSASWAEVSIPFTTLDKGGASAFGAGDILGFSFQGYEPTPISFNFCVDDISVY